MITSTQEEFEIRDSLRRIGVEDEDIAIVARHYKALERFFETSKDATIAELQRQNKGLRDRILVLTGGPED